MTYQQLVDKAIDWMPIFFENEPFYFTDIDTDTDTVRFLADSFEYFVAFHDDGHTTWGRYA